MTNFTSTHKFSAAAVFGAAALFSMISFGSNAEAASVASCKDKTAGAVVSCCEKLTAGGLPLWMKQSRTSCNEIAVCRGQKTSPISLAMVAVPVPRCFVQVVYAVDDGGPGDGGGRRGRGIK